MADHFSASIEFSASALEDAEVKKVLGKDGVEFEPLKSSNFEVEVAVNDGVFWMQNLEARWGQFEDLEALLRDKGVPFDRESSQAYDYHAELVIYRPARNGNPAQDLTMPLLHGDVVVPVRDIRDLLPLGVEAIQAYLDEHFPAYPPLSKYGKEG